MSTGASPAVRVGAATVAGGHGGPSVADDNVAIRVAVGGDPLDPAGPGVPAEPQAGTSISVSNATGEECICAINARTPRQRYHQESAAT